VLKLIHQAVVSDSSGCALQKPWAYRAGTSLPDWCDRRAIRCVPLLARKPRSALWHEHKSLDRYPGAFVRTQVGPMEHDFDLIEFLQGCDGRDSKA
jgi:hypothetical protein